MSTTTDPTAFVVSGTLSWPKLLTIIGAVFVGSGSIILTLLFVIYGSLKDDLQDAKKGVDELRKDYREAHSAATRVSDLLARAPNLEETTRQTRELVSKLSENVDLLKTLTSPMPQQLLGLQQNVSQLQAQLSVVPSQLQTIQSGMNDLNKQTSEMQSTLRSLQRPIPR
jgi:chromosome segregation ATPase